MPSPQQVPDLWGMFIALAISLLSGAVSIGRRILGGHQSTVLWVITEFLTAILCGYLMYNAYPVVSAYMPKWVTLPVAVAVAAHSGGRVFQEVEQILLEHYSTLLKRPRK